jgi:hypothetical protein
MPGPARRFHSSLQTLVSFMTAPTDRLAAALACRYRIERRLDEGGMADSAARWYGGTEERRSDG